MIKIKDRFLILIFLMVACGLIFGTKASAEVKILSDSRHAYTTIVSTINMLLGVGHVGTDVIVHSTNMGTLGPFSTSSSIALNSSTNYYNESGNLVPSQAPYQLFTTSATNYIGDTASEYDLSISNDLAHNYAYSAALPQSTFPPIFHMAPGREGGTTGYGVEWRLDCTVFSCSSLSGITAANAGLMASLRYLHPTWNWFDVKAALRQTGTNWNTGYDRNAFGFGQIDYHEADILEDDQIFLQPPVAKIDTVYTQSIRFQLYPFKQTRRVKDVLFQFSSAPSFYGDELTLAELEMLGGTKITEYSGDVSRMIQPLDIAVVNAYFVWLTADNIDDDLANFSRIDTYGILGPLSQSSVRIGGAFSEISDANSVTDVLVDEQNGKIYTVERTVDGNGSIVRMDEGVDGSVFGANPSDFSQIVLRTPSQAVLDSINNKVYITDSGNSRIVSVNSGTGGTVFGENWESFGSEGSGDGQVSYPFGISVDGANNRLYVADVNNSRIVSMDSGTGGTVFGENWESFGSEGSGINQFLYASGIFVDSANSKVYVSDYGNNRIVSVDSGEGATTLGGNWNEFGTYGSGVGQFDIPDGIYVDTFNNKIYVSDFFNTRIVSMDSGGGGTTMGSNWKEFGDSGVGAGQFLAPSGIFSDRVNNKLYIVDSSSNRVVKIDSGEGGTVLGGNWQVFGSSGSGSEQFNSPFYIFGDNVNNRIYVGDSGNDRIVGIDSGEGGTVLGENYASIPIAPFGVSNQVALDNENNKLYVADSGNDNIMKIDSGGGETTLGNVLETFGEHGSPEEGLFLEPDGIVADSVSNRLYVADSGHDRIISMDSGESGTVLGENLQLFGVLGSGVGQFNNPTGIAVDNSNDKIYIVDNSNHRIVSMDNGENGTVLGENWQSFGSLGSGSDQFRFPEDIFFSDDKLYVADTDNNRIVIIDSGSDFTSFGANFNSFGVYGDGSSEGQFNNPTSVSVDAQKKIIYVVDSGNGRIVQIIPPIMIIGQSQNDYTLQNQVIDCSADEEVGVYVQSGLEGTNFNNVTFLNCGISAILLRSELSQSNNLLFVNNASAVQDEVGGYTCTNCFDDSEDGESNVLASGQPDWNSPAIDTGITVVGRDVDYAGNSIYGTPDIGAYEYQPPYEMGTDEVDISANVRIYGDGKFRNTETASGITASLSIIPQGSGTEKWLDITKADDEEAIIWEANRKKWKESSTTLGENSTLHTIEDLTAGKSYTLAIDGSLVSEDPMTGNITSSDCIDSACVADDTGEITFNYIGGYSDHTFELTDNVAPVITVTSPVSGSAVSADDTITFTDSETTDPECSIDNSNWVNCVSTVTSFSDLTNWDDIAESDTFTLYMRDTDASSNTGTTNVSNLTKADTQAPVRSEGLPSSELSSGTTSTTLSLTTSETATCKYSNTPGTAYADMTELFTTEDGIIHTKDISNLSDGSSYSYYVRCQDLSENANDTDYLISFSVASPQDVEEDTDEEKDLDIHGVKAESTENSITITWKTDHNTKSSIRYGVDRNLKEKKKDNSKEKKHKIVIDGLQSNVKYYFRIKATDSNDNEDSSKIHSIMTKATQISITNQSQDENTSQSSAENTNESVYSDNSTPNICSYTIQSGDTLWSIAKQVYGDATQYQKIIEKNQDKYPDIETKLSIGQELSFGCENDDSKNDIEKNLELSVPNNNIEPQPQIKTEPKNNSSEKVFKWWNPFSWF
ncbi:MAG: hypothetical protein Athens071425_123 [Parcubacteria group bacterium Athens0714_25]|nr:MAG: hypothetical protein Athens071425_123 [Parcubacteria group bacterium Athens0714_25]